MVILRIKLLLYLISLQSSPSHLPSQFWFQCRISVGDVKSMAVPQFWIISLCERLARQTVHKITEEACDIYTNLPWFIQSPRWAHISPYDLFDLCKCEIRFSGLSERLWATWWSHQLKQSEPIIFFSRRSFFVSLHNDGGRLLTQCCNFIWAQAALSTEEVSL